jgi:hypothetical protein
MHSQRNRTQAKAIAIAQHTRVIAFLMMSGLTFLISLALLKI